jgi:hypothetical protein
LGFDCPFTSVLSDQIEIWSATEFVTTLPSGL